MLPILVEALENLAGDRRKPKLRDVKAEDVGFSELSRGLEV